MKKYGLMKLMSSFALVVTFIAHSPKTIILYEFDAEM